MDPEWAGLADSAAWTGLADPAAWTVPQLALLMDLLDLADGLAGHDAWTVSQSHPGLACY